jgi:hypothetical protein
MNAVDVGSAGLLLMALVVGGTMLHELLHAAVLSASGVPFTIRWFSPTDVTDLRSWASGGWATVRPDSYPPGVSPWQLRLAALAPMVMALPVLLVAAGVVPDPFPAGSVLFELAAVASMACAIPSPSDFSVVWHADRLLDEHGE